MRRVEEPQDTVSSLKDVSETRLHASYKETLKFFLNYMFDVFMTSDIGNLPTFCHFGSMLNMLPGLFRY